MAQVSLIQVRQPTTPNVGRPTGYFDHSGTTKAPNSEDQFRRLNHKGHNTKLIKEGSHLGALVQEVKEFGIFSTEIGTPALTNYISTTRNPKPPLSYHIPFHYPFSSASAAHGFLISVD
ncbi:hypothetical protein Salat_2752300 [Sesamum alatum]|uniref:Uncharacterized protein n=1 Tax=Sesamum alatum TaxID=300844 RepID=A0AAE1XL26_9LAMI|nr:hypothetical protein Salat_2752300 [Sesamum alatum]